MNVLLTGASGFIGKRCAMILLEKGAAVTALVRNPARLDPSLAAKVTVVASDLTSDEFAVRLDGLGAYDACVHCAANLKFYARQDEIDRVNVQATGRLLDWCARNSVKRFVFASSLEAIGPVARKDAPAVEDTEPHPVSQYGLSKLRAEQKVMSFSGRSITCQVLRLGNVYGPGSGFLVPAMADAIRKKGELARLRSVWQDFLYNPVYVDDAAAILAACSLEERGTNGIYNIGGNQVLTLGELHELIAGVIGRDAPAAPVNGFLKLILGLRTKMLRAAGLCDTMTYILSGDKGRDHRAVSIRRAAAELGYAPAVSLEQGIRRTLE